MFKLCQINTNYPNPGKGKKKLTTAERWKKKKEAKAVEEDPNSVSITKLTELANELLTRTGNMDIYQETYEQIKKKVLTEICCDTDICCVICIIFIIRNYALMQIEQAEKHLHPLKQEAELDMYADDFDAKEKAKLDNTNIRDGAYNNVTTY